MVTSSRMRRAVAVAALKAAIWLTRVVERAMMTRSGHMAVADARGELSAIAATYFPRRRLASPRARA